MTTAEDRGDDYTPPADDSAAAAAAEAAKTQTDADAAAEAEITRLAEEKAAGKEGKDDKTDDDEEDDDAAAKAGKPKREARIPLSRHKEMLERERADRGRLEARLAQYERGADVAATNAALTKAETDLVAKEKTYAALVSDGKPDEAAKVMGEIRLLERNMNEQRTALVAVAAESRAYERARYDTTVERVESAYPQLNPDDEDAFDGALANKVMRISKAYQLDGLTPSKALQEAVKDLLGDPVTAKEKAAVDTKPKVDAEDLKAAKAAERKETALRAAAEAAGKTPAALSKAGADSDKLGGGVIRAADVMKMSQDEFAKLDENLLAKMRGDALA